MTMVVVQNNPQSHPQNESLSSIPLPPGMEIVLGDKKYTIQYQSYEMTREKATEYIAKCTGTPYSRMSSPPDPVAMPRPQSDVGINRAVGIGGNMGTATATMTTAVAMAPTTLGDRGTIRMSPPTIGTSEEQQQRLQTPDEVYTTITPAASGLTSASTIRGTLPQPQQQVVTTGNTNYPPPQTYAPPPPPPPPAGGSEQQQQNLGYYWEDGVWKVWNASGTSNDSAGVTNEAAAKMPPPQPVAVQHSQQPPQPYAPERPQYQYQYSYSQPQTQQASFSTSSAAYNPASYAVPHSQQQQQQQPLQIPQIRGPPLPTTGVIQLQSHASGGSASTNANTDPMLTRYI